MLDRFPEIRKLPPDELIQLSSEIDELMFVDEPATDLDPALRAELDRRMEEYRRDPSTASTWPEVRPRLHERFGLGGGA